VSGDEAIRLLLSDLGTAVIAVASGDTSMEPHLPGGCRIALAPARDVPRPGDVLVYRQHDYLVVHRYLGPAAAADGRPCLRTRGDGRNVLDPPVFADAVSARVTAVERSGSWRSLDGPGAAFYARLVAWHALAWAAAGAVSRPVGAGALVAWLDRAVLRVGATLFFTPFHGRVAAPVATGPERSV
jgi:hypothetical protein